MPIDYKQIYKPQPLGGETYTASYPGLYQTPIPPGNTPINPEPLPPGNTPTYPPVTIPPGEPPISPIGGSGGGGAQYDWEAPWSRPSWMPGSAYTWGEWPAGVDPSWVQQSWLRSPEWKAHAIWNPYWGYQDVHDINRLYSEAGGPVSWEDFQTWGLTQQPGPDWEQYFGPKTGNRAAASATDGGNFYENFPYPGEWNLASMIYSMFGLGLPTQVPQEWEWISDWARQFAETGMPTDVSEWWKAEQPLLEQRISDQTKQMYEQAGLTGMEWSSPLGRSIAEMTGRETSNLWAELAEKQLGLTEAAKARQMGAWPMLFGVGQGITGLTEAAKNRAMSAAGGLSGLGQQKVNLPMNVAHGLYSTGMGQTMLSQEDINRQMQEFLRLSPEASPWLQMLLSLSGGMQTGYAPQMYNPSTWTQLMNAFTSILPLLLMNQ